MAKRHVPAFCVITNFRDLQAPVMRPTWRLIPRFLPAPLGRKNFWMTCGLAHRLFRFQFIGGWLHSFVYFSNRGTPCSIFVETGVYCVANHMLDTPWPKLVTTLNALKLSKGNDVSADALFSILMDRTRAADNQLPLTACRWNGAHSVITLCRQ